MYPVMKHHLGTDSYNDTEWGPQWYENIEETLQHAKAWAYNPHHTVDILLGWLISFILQSTQM